MLCDEVDAVARASVLRDKRKNARQAKARGPISKEQRHRVMVRDGYRCVDCGATTNLAVDHLNPVVETGPRRCTDDELAVRCKPCNGRLGGALSRRGRGHAASTRPPGDLVTFAAYDPDAIATHDEQAPF